MPIRVGASESLCLLHAKGSRVPVKRMGILGKLVANRSGSGSPLFFRPGTAGVFSQVYVP